MQGGFTASTRADWTDEERTMWSNVVDKAVGEEVDEHGGIQLEG